MDARVVRVSQSLFARTAGDGHTWEFAALAGGGCALLRDGQPVESADGSDEAVARLLEAFINRTGPYGRPAGQAAPTDPEPNPRAA